MQTPVPEFGQLSAGIRGLGSFPALAHPGKFVFPLGRNLSELHTRKSQDMGCLGTRWEDWVKSVP